MQKRWTLKHADAQKVAALQEALQISPVLCQLLVQRGITTFEAAKKFFRPTLEDLHDPFLMKDMDKAVQKIVELINANKKILVYGDYDVDGTTSVALVYDFFRDKIKGIEYYIPDRYKEGYGISKAGIDYAADNDFALVIALDCGIKAVDLIEYANSKGVAFIICDHHRPGDKIPNAAAVLDPKRSDCTYPYDELSGCGIGFKLIQAYAQKNNIDFNEVKAQLDLTAISIASDIVPITGENRVLAYYGLKKINENPRSGIRALMDLAGMISEDTGEIKELTIEDLVFKIGPRINAAGRMGDAKNAVASLIADDNMADEKADLLNKSNTDRRALDTNITEEAIGIIDENVALQKRKTTVLCQPHWHKGVIGIVASRLMDNYYRPTILLTESNGKLTGSARSVKGFDVYNAIKECEDLLEQFGGHKYAAGLTLKTENFDAFAEKFEEVVNRTITDEQLIPEIEIDAVIDFKDITPSFFKTLSQFAPFGPGNMKPVFQTKGVLDTGNSRIVKETHLKVELKKDNFFIKGIAFGEGKSYEKFRKNDAFDVCYTIAINEWNGQKNIEMMVKGFKF